VGGIRRKETELEKELIDAKIGTATFSETINALKKFRELTDYLMFY
jgi:hypothetical protein